MINTPPTESLPTHIAEDDPTVVPERVSGRLAATLVNAPVLGVVAPMAVEFRPVSVSRIRSATVPAASVVAKAI